MSDDLWHWIDALSERFEYGDKRGAKSRFIRDLLSDATAAWRHSPYTCQSADEIVVITREGHLFSHTTHDLYLNSRLDGVPCVFRQSPEKQEQYLQQLPHSLSPSEHLRDKWILNYFSARDGGLALDEKTDPLGAAKKEAVLEVSKVGVTVKREVLVGLRSYVQWLGDGVGELDRMISPPPCPLRNLQMSVVIDADLYEEGEARDLSLAFMNPEGVRFEDRAFVNMLDYPPKYRSGRHPTDAVSHSAVLQPLSIKMKFMKTRLKHMMNHGVDGMQIVDDPRDKSILRDFSLPARFLFLSMQWKMPHMSIVPCVEWKKPQRRQGA